MADNNGSRSLVAGSSGLPDLIGTLSEGLKLPDKVSDQLERLGVKFLKRMEELLNAEIDGEPDIETIFKVGQMIVDMKGWSAAERNRVTSHLEAIISRGFTYKERVEGLRRGAGSGAGVNINISREALDELNGV